VTGAVVLPAGDLDGRRYGDDNRENGDVERGGEELARVGKVDCWSRWVEEEKERSVQAKEKAV
jgi:hypothetical protein